MLGGVEFISVCAWLSPRFVIKPGALAEQGNLFLRRMLKNYWTWQFHVLFWEMWRKVLAVNQTLLGFCSPMDITSPLLSSKGDEAIQVLPWILNKFNTPDHLKCDLMWLKVKHLHIWLEAFIPCAPLQPKTGEEEGQQGSGCIDKTEQIIYN